MSRSRHTYCGEVDLPEARSATCPRSRFILISVTSVNSTHFEEKQENVYFVGRFLRYIFDHIEGLRGLPPDLTQNLSDGGKNGGASSRTLASDVYARLRRDLLTGRLVPGRKLQVRVLMERYAAGQTPIREALNRLASEHLVECHDQRGFMVAGISDDELRELTRTRCWVEELALRQAMGHATPAWEEELVLACHRLVRTPRSLSTSYEENPEWESRHRAFHRTLIEPCGSRPLRLFCDQLADQLYRYRQLSVRKIFPRRDVNAEHEMLLAAVLDGDVERAATLLVAHYRTTADIVLGESKEPSDN